MLVTPKLTNLIQANADFMLDRLLNILPPCRVVNHQIELNDPRLRPMAKVPYCLSRPKLEEMKRKLI